MKQNLSFEMIYAWPILAKIAFISSISIFIVVFTYYLHFNELCQEWLATKQHNIKLQNDLASTQKLTTDINNELPTYSINQLQAIGFLQQAQKLWGILRDPSGAIHEVSIGSIIGIENAKVMQITAEEIITSTIVLPIK